MENLTMNENSKGTPQGTGSWVAVGFVLGAVAGAGIALLLAPGTGKETRRRLTDVGERWTDTARSKIGQVRDTANDLRRDVKSALEAGRDAFEDGRRTTRTELKG
jgi:gas vesicle protein